VPGEGHSSAELFICAEAPGEVESNPELYDDGFGVPLVGPAGQLLQQVLTEAGWDNKRHKTFVTNVVKHRPPYNRTPLLEEQLACQPFLVKQIQLVKPKFILGLGRVAADTLCRLARIDRFGAFASQRFTIQDILVLTTYHPSYILRNPSKRSTLVEDIAWAISIVEEL
jgi:DNA polymerase